MSAYSSKRTYLVRKSKGQSDLVGRNVCVASAGDRSRESSGAGSERRASNAKGVHGDLLDGLMLNRN